MEIQTKNGFQQENRTTTVPRNAGTNKYPFDITGPSCSLDSSTDTATDNAVGGERIDKVEFLCCPGK